MESYTTLVDPLTTDQWVPVPCTTATLTPLWLEMNGGLVRVMECGVGQLQLVSVGGISGLDFVECM